LAAGVAAMGQFGITTVNVLEGSYVALLNFTHDLSKTVRILADAAALGFGLQGNIVGAGKSLAVAVAMSKVQDATNEALAGAGAMFDGFRAKVYAAQLQLAQMGKPPKDVSDSLDRMGQATRSATNSVTSFIPKVIELGSGSGGAAKNVKTATEKLKEYTDALKSSNSAQKSFTAAQKASVKAGQSLTEANQGVADAQAALDAAVAGYGANSPQAKKAAKDLESAQRGLERAGYNVEQSVFAVTDAEAALAKVRADPESTPQMIREAEITLAEAKLSTADAIDLQTEATDGLRTAQGLLNEKVSGALTDSETYKTLSDQLKDAKEKQATATDAVADAIDREAEAFKGLKDAIEAAGKVAALYPKVVAANPMAGVAATIPATVTGNSTGFKQNPSGSGMVVNVNAGIVSTPDQIAQELADLSDRYARLNGGGGFGSGLGYFGR
jgi:hypothetical protein